MAHSVNPFSAQFGHSFERKLLTALGYCAIIVFLYMMPHRESEAMQVHEAIVQALRAGTTWGRQAFIGSFARPVLPSLALLCCTILSEVIGTNAAILMVSLSQGLALIFLCRALVKVRSWYLAPLPVALVLAIPTLRQAMMRLDPNWLTALPVAAAAYFLVQWSRKHRLRDVMLVSLNLGLLAFCGVVPAIAGAIAVIVFYVQHRCWLKSQNQSADGAGTIILSTFLYCAFLWLLWNWLVMDNPFFPFHELAEFPKSVTQARVYAQFQARAEAIAACLFVLCPLVIVRNKSHFGGSAMTLVPLFVIPVLAVPVCFAGNIPLTGLVPMICATLLAAFVILLDADFAKPVVYTAAYLAGAVCCVAIWIAPALTRRDSPRELRNGAPDPKEITEFIDQFWPDSRTMLYGVELPALFPDPTEQRFVARVDYQEQDLLTQAHDEQMHLLVPPPTSGFYPKKGHPLADIHANGRPWLLLEKTWPNGWQLYRLVQPPKNESRLDFLRQLNP
ncbi:MAG: hypothetical protein IJJ26_07500 [Victivallales bacterium]|nr:hypothetical protein [Victivallales bacterium]